MNTCLRSTFVSLWLLFASFLFAQQQVGVIIPPYNNATPGSFINLPVKVVNFDSIASVQFVVRWDKSVLKFKNVNSFGLQGMTLAQSFNTLNTLDSGLLRFAWEAPSSFPGTSVADSTIIFRIRFDIVGDSLSGSTVVVTQSFPTFFEITKVNADSSLTDYKFGDAYIRNSFVAVAYTATSVKDAQEWQPLPARLSPNPFVNVPRLSFDLEKTGEVEVLVHDAAGRLLQSKNLGRLGEGAHQIDLDTGDWPQSSVYFLTIRSEARRNILRIVKQ